MDLINVISLCSLIYGQLYLPDWFIYDDDRSWLTLEYNVLLGLININEGALLRIVCFWASPVFRMYFDHDDNEVIMLLKKMFKQLVKWGCF